VTLRYFAWPFQAERSMMAAGKHTSITHGCRKLHPNSLVTSPSGTCLEQSGIQVLCHLDEWDLGAFLMAASGAPQLGGHANLHDTRLPNETTRRSHSQLHRLFFFPPSVRRNLAAHDPPRCSASRRFCGISYRGEDGPGLTVGGYRLMGM